MNYLTLKEMAARFNQEPKPFARLVRDINIPYLPTSSKPTLRGALFDPQEVEAHCNALRDAEPVDVLAVPVSQRKFQQFVYLIWAVNSTRYKIGLAYNPAKRLRDLNVGSPLDLRLLAAIPSDLVAEKALHEYFDQHRIKGEWFDFSTPDIPLLMFKGWTVEYYEAYVRGDEWK